MYTFKIILWDLVRCSPYQMAFPLALVRIYHCFEYLVQLYLNVNHRFTMTLKHSLRLSNTVCSNNSKQESL